MLLKLLAKKCAVIVPFLCQNSLKNLKKFQNMELTFRSENKKALRKGFNNNNNLERSGRKKFSAASQNRTGDTRIFSPLLYRLS